MKNRYLYGFILLCFNALVITSCIKEEWGVGNIDQSKDGGEGGWNKNKTIEVYYLTTLANKSVTNVTPVTDFFIDKGDACSLGIVDRTDVGVGATSGTNPVTQMAFATARFSSFALNKMTVSGSNTQIEGATILFNHKINSEQSFKIADNCFLKYINIQATTTTAEPIKILVPFSTVRFDSKEQIDAAESTFNILAGTAYEGLVIGTVKTSLLADLENVSKKIAGYTFTEVTKNAETEYSIFMIGKSSWVLREMTKTSVDGNLNAFCLSIEASVE